MDCNCCDNRATVVRDSGMAVPYHLCDGCAAEYDQHAAPSHDTPRRVWSQSRGDWEDVPVADGTEWADLHDRSIGLRAVPAE